MGLERWVYTVTLRLRSLFQRDRVEDELDEELRFHVDRLTEEHVARRLTPDAARLAARRAMHGLEQRKEECRDTRRVAFIEDLLRDLRYAARTLRRSPGFALAAVGTLVLGLGTTVAMFTVINGVPLRPMPFPDPDRLFLVSRRDSFPRGAGRGWTRWWRCATIESRGATREPAIGASGLLSRGTPFPVASGFSRTMSLPKRRPEPRRPVLAFPVLANCLTSPGAGKLFG
jgi:hypothetical protein